MKNTDLINNFIKIIKNINLCHVHSTKKINICIKFYRDYRLPSFPKTKATETLILIITKKKLLFLVFACVCLSLKVYLIGWYLVVENWSINPLEYLI